MHYPSITKHIDLSRIDFNDKASVEQACQEILNSMKEKKLTFAQVVGLDKNMLEEAYACAHTQYNAGHYAQALEIFDFLINLSPNTFKFIFGAAACLYQLKEYEIAAQFFYVSLVLDQTNPWSAFYIAECALKKNMKEEAIETLELALEIAKKNKIYQALATKCLLLKNKLQKEG